VRVKASLSAVVVVVALALTDTDTPPRAVQDEPAATPQPQECTSASSLAEHTATYEFFGARAAAAGNSLRQRLLVANDHSGQRRTFTGQTDWHIEWRICLETLAQRCRIGGVISNVNVTYTLPRWADRNAAPPRLRARWDRYIESLASHERGHGVIAQRVAGMIEEALVGRMDGSGCDQLTAEAGRIVDEVMRRGEAMQREYDRITGHGSAQGAMFPF
jgi:predicted secreted Zn-dependent protease